MSSAEVIIESIEQGELDRTRELLDGDPDLASAQASDGNTPLLAAIRAGNDDAMRLLLDRGAESEIFAAAALGDVQRIKVLLNEEADRAVDFGFDGWTPLHVAARYGQMAAVEALLEGRGYLPRRSRNRITRTALHEAIAGGHTEMVELLLDRGSNVKPLDGRFWTPLHIAVDAGRLDVVELLIRRGADLNQAKRNGDTPLSMAEAAGLEEIAKLLRDNGAGA